MRTVGPLGSLHRLTAEAIPAISFRPAKRRCAIRPAAGSLPPCHASGRPYLLKGLRSNPVSYVRVTLRGVKRSGAPNTSQNRNSYSGPSVSFAQSSRSGPANPKAEGIGSTSSTHNPRPSSPGPTGMEKGNATGSEMGTNPSTHNPSEKR